MFFLLLCSLQQAEAALRGVVPEAVNPEKLSRATESLAKLRAQLATLRSAEGALQAKVTPPSVLSKHVQVYRKACVHWIYAPARRSIELAGFTCLVMPHTSNALQLDILHVTFISLTATLWLGLAFVEGPP